MTRRDILFGAVAFAVQGAKLDEATRLITAETSSGRVAAATLHVRNGSDVFERAFGKAPSPEAVFLLASITKPMTATAVMILADRKQLALTHPVQRFIPEFKGDGRERITIRHLLTHTSGLPDMLPENVDLRKRHAPLSEFVAATCRTPLLFTPGSEVRYQSMGILLAAEIVERITGQPLPAFLRTYVFDPLGMKRASLGLGGRAISDTMLSQVDERTDYDWNSPYWRNLASPWGGAHASAADVGRFLRYFSQPDGKVVKAETAAAMVSDQTPGMRERWGLGWSLKGSKFGRGSSESTYGHGGSTGTLCWHDRTKDLTFVLLCTKPADHSNKTLLYPASDIVSEATRSAAPSPDRRGSLSAPAGTRR
jgi:CubicO group peptidase (beta-lactamase class C family)